MIRVLMALAFFLGGGVLCIGWAKELQEVAVYRLDNGNWFERHNPLAPFIRSRAFVWYLRCGGVGLLVVALIATCAILVGVTGQ